MATTESTTIRFDKNTFDLIHKQANLVGQTTTKFMRNAILERLEDKLDYQNAVENIRKSNGQIVSRANVKKQLGL